MINWSVKSATESSFSLFSASSVMVFVAGLGASATVEADGEAGVGVTDQARGVGMDSISAVPDRELKLA